MTIGILASVIAQIAAPRGKCNIVKPAPPPRPLTRPASGATQTPAAFAAARTSTAARRTMSWTGFARTLPDWSTMIILVPASTCSRHSRDAWA